MSYTDDSVKAKLSALNETQEGIVAVAQWIMFHRRFADRTATLWMHRLRDSSPPKRLNLIYLANEVVQQSKARKKNEFVAAFSPIIAEATTTAYKGATHDVQQKLRRVIEVWRQRLIFDPAIQDAVERGVDELDRSREKAKKPALGGSLFSSSSSSAAAPQELQPLVQAQNALAKAELASKPAVASAKAEFHKLTDPTTPLPTPPVHAARLSALLKGLANAEGAVAETLKARRELLSGLETLINTHRAALAEDAAQAAELAARRENVEARKRDVEDGIMRGLSETTPADATPEAGAVVEEPERPDIEALTPPPVESLTPIGTPPPLDTTGTTAAANMIEETETHAPTLDDRVPSYMPPGLELPDQQSPSAVQAHGPEQPKPLDPRRRRGNEGVNGNGEGAGAKRRKMSVSKADDDFAEFTSGGLDSDVAEMLGRE
ncbi:hypothetical protein H2201_003624 [Coniosporium apollinis]|uniref:CID domain-containing protein n=1 Tax=Coniosporium apollinis TaxID=61459 RepID=A0ABQ9NXZ0_9PEZI|nr:hypothetical protein H2201_003624 [Coniosporium apollinis]